MKRFLLLAGAFAAATAATLAHAQKPIAYPAKGQSSQQQQKDDAACATWAKQNTGIDPVAASQPAPQQTGPATGGGERVRGAARGAVGGAVVGGITGDAGTGAAVVRRPGTMAGGARAAEPGGAEPAGASAAAADAQHVLARWRGACMEGRGYTIK